MTRVIQITKVQETHLWSVISEQNSDDARSLLAAIQALSVEASDRIKGMYRYAHQYTLHDDRHSLRVTEIMALILGDSINQLNLIEISLLILSAYFHDQGMVPSKEETENLHNDEEFLLFKDNWQIEHPNYQETQNQLESSSRDSEERKRIACLLTELDAATLTDYLRVTHGERSAELVNSLYKNDKRMEIQGVNISPLLAKLCVAHTYPCGDLNPENGFHYDEQIGTYSINMPFLSALLRLADILDFDRDRTPEILLKNIHFTSEASLNEWEKHRSVEGWQISQDLIRFTIRSKHPAYEAAARKYMDWIDRELVTFKEIQRKQPRAIKGKELNLPSIVDRSRIEPLDDAYRAFNLEFSLSRDEVIRLFMTDKLYGSKHLCIRELLQNSLDALRYRKAMFLHSGTDWDDGCVEFKHHVNSDGYEVLECKDNGSGMDEEIINNHFVRVGRSYYRSPLFDRERMKLRASGHDFDPCSKFGIGFMSCFMLGDRINIITRRDYGAGKNWGEPLTIEVHGLSGLLIVRKGEATQPIGTTVSIVCRKKPSFLDRWTDDVMLCTVLKGYALATEFPIQAKCEIEEIRESVDIPTHPEKTPTFLEVAQVKNRITLEQDLSAVAKNLGGFVRESFLVDSEGLPCLKNEEAEWRGKTEGTTKKWDIYFLPTDRTIQYDYTEWSVPVCTDGILVAGTPGRPSYRKKVRARLGTYSSPMAESPPALIDSRGKLKPE